MMLTRQNESFTMREAIVETLAVPSTVEIYQDDPLWALLSLAYKDYYVAHASYKNLSVIYLWIFSYAI